MTESKDTATQLAMEILIKQGPEAMTEVFRVMFNEAMRCERENHLNAAHYERSDQRTGYANGYKGKKIDTPAGTIQLDIPKSAGHDQPFYPQSLERGKRSSRALMAAAAEMYIHGVSTRRVESVMQMFGVEHLSSSQVSRATKLLDEELSAWRNRSLGKVLYVNLDARYEKVRENGVVISAAVLSAIGVMEDGKRSILGIQVALSEAEVNWREFLKGLVNRGLHGVQYIVSDDHSGLTAALNAVFPGVIWQRCQFHLSQNAIHHAPNANIRKRIGAELRGIWNAPSKLEAELQLKTLTGRYQEKYPALADWLENNVPQALAVFSLPEAHRRKMRTSNGIERAIQQELKRRTQLVRVFPNRAALLRLVSAILIEMDEEWTTADKRYIVWETE